MFKVDEILGIKIEDEIKLLENLPNKILLVPEMIEDTIKKINMIGYKVFPYHFSTFVNGYSRYSNSETYLYLSKKGEKIDFSNIGRPITDHFHCDCMYIEIETKEGIKKGIFNAENKKVFMLPCIDNCKMKYWFFSCDLAPVVAEPLDGSKMYIFYIDKCGKIVSKENYSWASQFYDNKAIVKTVSGIWKMIDSSFRTITVFNNPNFDELGCKLVKEFDNLSLHLYEDNIEFNHNSNGCIMKDLDTGFSIKIYTFIKKIAELLQIELKSKDVKSKLLELVSEAAKKGTYIFDLYTLTIENPEIIKGIKISDENGNNLYSFDEEDKAMVRTRLNQGVDS